MTLSLMAYVPGAVVAHMGGSLIVPDFANNRFYSGYQGGAGGSEGISQFTGYLSGAVTLAKTAATIGLAHTTEDPMCLTYNGNLIFPIGNGSNSVQLAQVRAADLSLLSTYGAVSASLSASVNGRILAVASMAPARYGKTDFVIATPTASNLGEVCVLTIPGMFLTNLGNTTEPGRATVGPGLIGTSSGTAYVLGRDVGLFTTNTIALYVVAVPALSLTKLATFTPANIDATWATFVNAHGVAYDQTDGNVLIGVKTTDAVATKSYVCKLNGTTGALIWKCAIPYNPTNPDNHFRTSSIKHGVFYIYGDTHQGGPSGFDLYTLNTLTGVATSQRVSDMVINGGTVSEDTSNSITANAAWLESATTPAYIGDYMGTGGNHTYSGWMRLFLGAIPPIPAPPPFSVLPVVSVNRAWSYVLDGHTFYVLDLGAQGTFQYDQITKQWSQCATGALATTGGNNPQWNFQNGGMWGTRIVGGDLTLPTVWETTPASTLDNDATQISHASTGGINARSRTYVSCDAVRLSASFGLLDSSTAVTFNLRYSDDNENTWSDYFPVTLTPGNFGDEIAWNSLGSFMSPGRIFELTDVGGLIRIDGCDAFLNGFDNDQQGQDNGGQ